jgi:hypothetical protein
VGDERDRHKLASDEPDVEAHRFKVHPDGPADEADDDVEAHRFKVNSDEPTDEADDDDDTPDVEAHRHKL